MSNFKVNISRGYKRDIKKICDYMKNYNIEEALENIEEDIDNLTFMPRIHKTLYSYKDPEGEYRRIVSGKYIIIYKIEKNQVIILRIFSHKQNYLNSESFILKEEPIIYNEIKNINKGSNVMRKLKKIKNSFSREKINFTHIITEEEALERYMIKLIDEAGENLANGGKTIPFEEWQEKMRRKYNVAI